jgi:outer membrane immunogenic protein
LLQNGLKWRFLQGIRMAGIWIFSYTCHGYFEGTFMNKFTMMAAGAVFIGGASLASAADLGGSYKDEPIASYGPAYSWAGLYIGGSAGFGTGDTQTTLSAFDDSLKIADYDINGAIYGAHIGYNFQRGAYVFGLEAGINGTDMDGSQGLFTSLLTSEREMDWYATATARLGYTSGKTLFYGFGGVAWADVTSRLALGGTTLIEDEESHIGWTAGLGIEHAVTNNFIVRVEYSHVDLGEETTSYDIAREFTVDKDVDLKFDAIKIGASYKFGGRDQIEPLK